MSDREKAIQLLKDLPNNIPMKEIIDAIILMLELNDRIDKFDEEDVITNDELLHQPNELNSEEYLFKSSF